MKVEFTVNVMKDFSCTCSIARRQDSFSIKGVAINRLYNWRPNEEGIFSIVYLVLCIF